MLIGAPVAHSLSPAMHDAAFRALGMDAVFIARHVEIAELAAVIDELRASPLVLGASVTVPHKQRVIECCDALAPPADRIGAVNCLQIERSGGAARVIGHNTDAAGFMDSLAHDAGFDARGMRVVLLGAGGAARAVYAGLVDAGAEMGAVIARAPGHVRWVDARPWTADVLERACRTCDLLVDCTSAGLDAATEARVPAAIPVASLPAHALVASLVYHREPALLGAARARGLATLSGAGMLVRQGARAFELWTGRPAPVDIMWSAAFARV